MRNTIAILEDNLDRRSIMRDCLADRFSMYEICFVDEAARMIEFLQENWNSIIAIALDNDLEMKPGVHGKWIDPGSGVDVAEFLASREPICPVVIHTTNSSAALTIEESLDGAGWTYRRVVPFDDMNWIKSDWFPAMRRAVVGPVRV